MRLILVVAAFSLVALNANAEGQSKEKIKEAAVAVKEDAKSLFKKVSGKVKTAAIKTKAKIHEETKPD